MINLRRQCDDWLSHHIGHDKGVYGTVISTLIIYFQSAVAETDNTHLYSTLMTTFHCGFPHQNRQVGIYRIYPAWLLTILAGVYANRECGFISPRLPPFPRKSPSPTSALVPPYLTINGKHSPSEA